MLGRNLCQKISRNFSLAALFLLLVASPAFVAAAQEGMERVGEYEIYYNVLPTSFLNPQVAQGYGVVRSKGQGMVRVTVLHRLADGSSEPVKARVSGHAGNLAGQLNGLSFHTHQVGQDNGYFNLATFRFAHDDPMRFNLRVTYNSKQPAHELSFIRRLYMD
ncbi:DUF4426 domain-containing protein [Marinospirillum insulare]|uniref:DUF4426 domain-containing protein n=1 Tax=Marinospirillum insulare TaxID=217169 RepID=A0ABQ5ZWY1_9GAMM|nr:DUF4426 domain-containing protein [Marinospirillum insulare]GLR63525.1 hypothetical protein GCM10007878_09600 [Marinospirillum insulare]